MVFAAWDAEEVYLVGSRHYVARDPLLPLSKHITCVNLDCVGNEDADGLLLCTRYPRLAALARTAGEKMGIPTEVAGQGLASDDRPFAEAGIPSLGLMSQNTARIHTPEDTPEHLSTRRLAEAGRVALWVVFTQAFVLDADHR